MLLRRDHLSANSWVSRSTGCTTTGTGITAQRPHGSSVRIQLAGRVGRRTRMLMSTGIRFSSMIRPDCRWCSHTRRFRRRVAGLGRQAVFRSGLTTCLTDQHGRSHHRMLTTRMGRRRRVSPETRKGFAHLRAVTIGSKIRTEEGMAGAVRTGACGFRQDHMTQAKASHTVGHIGTLKRPVATTKISFLVEHVVDEQIANNGGT
jgi:hypothetical protein